MRGRVSAANMCSSLNFWVSVHSHTRVLVLLCVHPKLPLLISCRFCVSVHECERAPGPTHTSKASSFTLHFVGARTCCACVRLHSSAPSQGAVTAVASSPRSPPLAFQKCASFLSWRIVATCCYQTPSCRMASAQQHFTQAASIFKVDLSEN